MLSRRLSGLTRGGGALTVGNPTAPFAANGSNTPATSFTTASGTWTAGKLFVGFVSGQATHARVSLLVSVVGWFAVTAILSSLRGALGGVRES